MKYAYHNTGLMAGTGGGDKRALGSLGGGSTLARPTLPVPGAPETMAGMGDCGCGCKGAGTCGGMGGTAGDILGTVGSAVGAAANGDPASIIYVAGGGYVLYRLIKHFTKKRR